MILLIIIHLMFSALGDGHVPYNEKQDGVICTDEMAIIRSEEGTRIKKFSTADERCNICIMVFPKGEMMPGYAEYEPPVAWKNIPVSDKTTSSNDFTQLYKAFYRGNDHPNQDLVLAYKPWMPEHLQEKIAMLWARNSICTFDKCAAEQQDMVEIVLDNEKDWDIYFQCCFNIVHRPLWLIQLSKVV